MELKQAVETLESKDEFKQWKKEHSDFYLAHGFMIKEENQDWQIGYTDGEKVVTFFLEPFNILPEQESYKKPDQKIQKLDKNELKLSFEEVMRIFNSLCMKKYSAEAISKTIIIVQNVGTQVFNITGLTMSLKTLNVKIDMSGKVIEDSCKSLIDQNQ